MTKYLVYLICSISLIGGEMNLGNENTIPSFKSSISTESSVNVAPILKEISSLDKYYDYSVYKEYKSQYLVVAYRKNEKDTMLDISYMTADEIVIWLDEKRKENQNAN